MKYLRLGMKMLRTSWKTHLLTVLQLAAALLVTAVMVSAAQLRFRRYTPFADYFGRPGMLVLYSEGVHFGDIFGVNERFTDPAQLTAHLSAPAEAIGPYNTGTLGVIPDGGDTQFQHYSYDADYWRRWSPKLQSGRYFDPESDAIEAVVSANDDYRTGDTLRAVRYLDTYGDRVQEVTVQIVGMLDPDEPIPGETGENTGDFRLYWRPSNAEATDTVYLLFSKERLCRLCENEPLTAPTLQWSALIRYTGDVTPEQLSADRQLLTLNGATHMWDMAELNENSRVYLYTEVRKLLPIVVMLMILVAVSAVSAAAITTRQRLRDYAVCALTGLPWNRCIRISLMQTAVTAAAAVMAAAIAYAVMRLSPLHAQISVTLGKWQLLCCGLLLICYFLIAMLMPVLMIRRSSVRQILHERAGAL